MICFVSMRVTGSTEDDGETEHKEGEDCRHPGSNEERRSQQRRNTRFRRMETHHEDVRYTSYLFASLLIHRRHSRSLGSLPPYFGLGRSWGLHYDVIISYNVLTGIYFPKW